MGATSVTGVSGTGEAGVTRGPQNNRTLYTSLLDPHIVWSGNGVLSSGGEGDPDSSNYRTVALPSHLILPSTRLTVVCGGKAWLDEKIVDGDGNMTEFVVFGAGGCPFDYVVIDAVDPDFVEDVYCGGES